jgi:hypothetical protein
MTARELDQIGAMNVGHICDVLEMAAAIDTVGTKAEQKALKALLVLLEQVHVFLDNEDDHVGRFAMGIAMNAIAARTDGISDELTAKCIAQNMEDLAYLLLVQMEEAGESWNPELVSQLKRIQHPSFNDGNSQHPYLLGTALPPPTTKVAS